MEARDHDPFASGVASLSEGHDGAAPLGFEGVGRPPRLALSHAQERRCLRHRELATEHRAQDLDASFVWTSSIRLRRHSRTLATSSP